MSSHDFRRIILAHELLARPPAADPGPPEHAVQAGMAEGPTEQRDDRAPAISMTRARTG